MSRGITMTVSKKALIQDIEDLDLDERPADTHAHTRMEDAFDEASHKIAVEGERPDRSAPVVEEYVPPKKGKATKSIKFTHRNAREIDIHELDPNIIPPTLENYMDPAHTGSKIVIIGKPGCLAKGTKVVKADGMPELVENIQRGDLLAGDNHTSRTVLDLCRGRETMYRVYDDFNNEYIVNEGHILTLQLGGKIFDVTLKDSLRLRRPRTVRSQWPINGRYVNRIEEWQIEPLLEEFGRLDISSQTYLLKIIIRQYSLTRYEPLLELPLHMVKKVKRLCQALMLELTPENNLWLVRGRLSKLNDIYSDDDDVHDIENPLLHIEKLEEDDYYGFTLSGNGRFLLDNYMVTHNTGKSNMIKSILYEKSEIFPIGQFFSGTEDSNGFYQEFIPSILIFNKLNPTAYVNFVKRQKIAKRYVPVPWGVALWDDVTEDTKIFNTPMVQGTYKNGRHWKMLHILSLQYCLDVKPVIRTNIDGTFILRETNKKNRKTLWENYSSAIPDFSDFCQIMDTVTEDYRALYIHNRVQSNSFQDCVFYYQRRDDIPPDWKFGADETWLFNSTRMNPDYVDPVC
jgi:hypothetical protein